MFQEILQNLRRCWKPMVLTDLLLQLLAVSVLTPLAALLFRAFVAVSGRTVLADTDIARFLLHPIGWITVVVVGAVTLGALAIELGALLLVALAVEHPRPLRSVAVLRFVLGQARNLLLLAGQVVVRVMLLVLPHLLLAAGVFVWLISEHDINFYLAQRPPEFWWAVLSIGLVLIVLAVWLWERAAAWAFALPLVILEDCPPRAALRESASRGRPARRRIASVLAVWVVCNGLLRLVISLGIVQAARFLVELFSVRLTPLVIVIGLMVMAVWVGNLVAGLIAHASLASTMAVLYRRVLGGDLRALERLPRVGQVPWRWRPTAPRMISLAVITLLAAGLVGVGLVQTLDFDDRVEITAHRGGGSEVPENTLAAIEQGIAAGADWIEVDVQESSDGVVMVVHDSDLKRLAGKPVKIWEATAEELRRINLAGDRDAPLAARRMPTLREVLELCRGKAGVNIELKYYGHERALEAGVAEVVEATGMTEQVVAMSLKMDAVRKLKRLRPGWRVGLLTAVTVSDLTRSEADFLAVKSSLASRSFVQQAHRSGKAVAAWTLNDPYSISLMASRGVDQLITDRPGLARQVIQEREEMMPLERLGLEIAHALGVKPAPR